MAADSTGNPSSMRKLNRKIVYDAIFRSRELSRVQLTRITKLKPPTISNIIMQLQKENLIINSGKGDINPRGGPLPELYRINCTGKYFIGVDISFEAISGVLLDSDLCTVKKQNISMNEDISNDQKKMLAAVDSLIQGFLKAIGPGVTGVTGVTGATGVTEETDETGASGDLAGNAATKGRAVKSTCKGVLAGIGISASGLVDHENCFITLSRIRTLDKADFRRLLADKYSAALYVDNDINILLSDIQASDSSLKASDSVLCFGIRSRGVGMSIASGGRLYRGKHNISGNITLFDKRKSLEDIAVEAAGYKYSPGGMNPSEFLMQLLMVGKEENRREKFISGVKNSLHEMNECIAMLQRVFDTEHIIIASQCPSFRILHKFWIQISRPINSSYSNCIPYFEHSASISIWNNSNFNFNGILANE